MYNYRYYIIGLILLLTIIVGSNAKLLQSSSRLRVGDTYYDGVGSGSSSDSSNEAWPFKWYNQTLNHFDALDSRTFLQRYYVNDQYYDYSHGGPIILYINGEGPVSSPPYLPDDNVVLVAQAVHGIIVTLEHRYYGDSSPFEDLQTKNLKFLSSRQALNDLADFVTDFASELVSANGGGQQVSVGPIVTYGGSYSGALSAWFRTKYPHVTVGSIASSGVVNAILDFTAFDEYVAFAAGQECADALRNTTYMAEQAYANGELDQVRQILNAETLVELGDFFYFLADSMAEGIQYGFHNELCQPLIEAMQSGENLIKVYANYTQNVWGKYLGTPAEYATLWQQNTTHDINKSADRLWWFQTCTEFGYFQAAPAQGSIRSQFVNMTYHRDHCQQLFCQDLSPEESCSMLWPNTEATNKYYGGNQTAGSNIVFINGSQDPWSRASITQQIYPTDPVQLVTCENCGHCVDIRGCIGGCIEPNNLAQVRQYILTVVELWVSQYSN